MNKRIVIAILSFLPLFSGMCRADNLDGKFILTYLVDGKPYQKDTLAPGAPIRPIDGPVKEGYVFSGWKYLPDVMPSKDLSISGSLLMNKYSGMSGMKEVNMDSVMWKLTNMTVEDYVNLELPTLDVLYENARQANAVKYYEYEARYYKHDIASARRQPLDWLRFFGTYSFGNTDLAGLLLTETTYQVWQQNSSTQRNLYFNIGATVSIPLGDIVNNRNLVKQRKEKYSQTLARQESEWDVQKERIVSLYCSIIEKVSALPELFEALVLAQAQYDFAETEFINNRMDAEALYRCKTYEKGARTEYEQYKSSLNEAIMLLEIVSCTPIISK